LLLLSVEVLVPIDPQLLLEGFQMLIMNHRGQQSLSFARLDTLSFNDRVRVSATSVFALFASSFFMPTLGLLEEGGENRGQRNNKPNAEEGDRGHAPESRIAGRTGLLSNISEREHKGHQSDNSECASKNVKISSHTSASYFSACEDAQKSDEETISLSAIMKTAAIVVLALSSVFTSWNAAAQATIKRIADAPDVQQRVNQLIKMDQAWGGEMTTPGMMLTMIEKSRSASGITYQLHAQGAPTGKDFVLLNWTLGDAKPKRLMFGVRVDASGTVVCANAEGPCKDIADNEPLVMKFQTVAGEPVRVGLMAADGSAKLLDEEVPTPLRVKDGACTLNAVLLAPDAEVVLFQGTGFGAAESLNVTSTFNGKMWTDSKRADATGDFLVADLPKVDGARSGLVTVTAKGTTCSPSLTVPFGENQLAKKNDDGADKPAVPVVASVR
jgi:hypothetical protein